MQSELWLSMDQFILTYCLLVGLTALLSRLRSVRGWLHGPARLSDQLVTSLFLGLASTLTDLLILPLAFVSVNTRYILPIVAGILGGPVSGVATGVVAVVAHVFTRMGSSLEYGLLVPPLVGLTAGLLALRREGRVSPAKTAGIGAVALLTDSVLDVWLEGGARAAVTSELAIQAGNLAAILLCVAVLQWEQREGVARQHIETLAFTDELTQLHNYRSFRACLEASLRQCREAGTPLSLVLMDVDGFKQYNDRFGHPAGNLVLERVGTAIRSELRATDVGARYGGDEFALILSGTTEAGAWSLVQRIQERLNAAMLAGRSGDLALAPVRLTPGVATFPAMGGDEETLLTKADEAMYLAKRDPYPALDLAAAAGESSLEEQ